MWRRCSCPPGHPPFSLCGPCRSGGHTSLFGLPRPPGWSFSDEPWMMPPAKPSIKWPSSWPRVSRRGSHRPAGARREPFGDRFPANPSGGKFFELQFQRVKDCRFKLPERILGRAFRFPDSRYCAPFRRPWWTRSRPRSCGPPVRRGVKLAALVGGVACNTRLREKVSQEGENRGGSGPLPAPLALHRQRRHGGGRGLSFPAGREAGNPIAECLFRFSVEKTECLTTEHTEITEVRSFKRKSKRCP